MRRLWQEVHNAMDARRDGNGGLDCYGKKLDVEECAPVWRLRSRVVTERLACQPTWGCMLG